MMAMVSCVLVRPVHGHHSNFEWTTKTACSLPESNKKQLQRHAWASVSLLPPAPPPPTLPNTLLTHILPATHLISHQPPPGLGTARRLLLSPDPLFLIFHIEKSRCSTALTGSLGVARGTYLCHLRLA